MIDDAMIIVTRTNALCSRLPRRLPSTPLMTMIIDEALPLCVIAMGLDAREVLRGHRHTLFVIRWFDLALPRVTPPRRRDAIDDIDTDDFICHKSESGDALLLAKRRITMVSFEKFRRPE